MRVGKSGTAVGPSVAASPPGQSITAALWRGHRRLSFTGKENFALFLNSNSYFWENVILKWIQINFKWIQILNKMEYWICWSCCYKLVICCQKYPPIFPYWSFTYRRLANPALSPHGCFPTMQTLYWIWIFYVLWFKYSISRAWILNNSSLSFLIYHLSFLTSS